MAWINNQWIKYLEGYCKGQNQIQDEYVRKVAKNLGLDAPLDINFVWQQEIISKFESSENYGVIILTGTAGDGKTKLCRDIVKQIDQETFDEDIWNAHSYFSSSERTIVKDFSELQSEKSLVIKELIGVLDSGKILKPILIAVNDGILIEEIDILIDNSDSQREIDTAKKLKEIIEDKINLGYSDCEQQSLINLINLSKLNAKDNFYLILDSIINHSGWNACNDCEGKLKGTCPIYNKYEQLRDNSNIRENLSNIILLLQLNNEHFTIRELLNLATNTLLASTPKAKYLKITKVESTSPIYTCKRVAKIAHNQEVLQESTIEVGFWGMNLGQHKMNNSRPYSEINKLLFGELSTNYWDNYLKKQAEREVSIPLDNHSKFFDTKRVLESNIDSELWGAILRRSRIQLFCYQDKNEKAYFLQKFSSFGYYKNKLYDKLIERDKCDDLEVISVLVLALNRVFHGRFISENSGRDRLYIPEKGQGSITPISIFHGDELRERNIYITKIFSDINLSGARVEPVLIFEIDRGVELKLALTVELFDFLFQISKGAPPNTTNPRLYKKLLIFRSKLASRLSLISRSDGKRIETYTIKKGDFRPLTLKVNHG